MYPFINPFYVGPWNPLFMPYVAGPRRFYRHGHHGRFMNFHGHPHGGHHGGHHGHLHGGHHMGHHGGHRR